MIGLINGIFQCMVMKLLKIGLFKRVWLNLKGAKKVSLHKYVRDAIRYWKNSKYIILAPDKIIISYRKVR